MLVQESIEPFCASTDLAFYGSLKISRNQWLQSQQTVGEMGSTIHLSRWSKWQEILANVYSLSIEKVAHQKIEGWALIDIFVTLLDLVKSQTASINQLNDKFNALQASLAEHQ
eukprot:scaffold253_cov72-Cylindrotheca_fusiformis.AAC.4